jgi:hypothetical protein
MWRAMAVIASLRDRKLAVSIPDSLESRLASMTNSDGEASVIVPRGCPSRSLNVQIPAPSGQAATVANLNALDQRRMTGGGAQRGDDLEAVMDRDVVDGLAQHKTDQCNDMQVCERLR